MAKATPESSNKGRVKKANSKGLTLAERSQIDAMLRRDKASPTDASRRVNAGRRKRGVRDIGKSAVFRYAAGKTFKLGAEETRGRKRALSKQDIRRLDQARRRLIKNADNDLRVTYAAIVKEAGLEGVVCQRLCEDALRNLGVSFKTPRRKVYISEKDAKTRYTKAKAWAKRPASFWATKAYVDNKAFPTPLTPAQRKRLRQTMVTGHLRTASEGTDRGFTKPREKHSFIGIPAVTISAAVAKDKVIMWHAVGGTWNGAAAATMYEDHLKPALVRTWGARARYTIVEDGDRKGNTSGKGIDAKARAWIHAITLPPRTPSLMPLDYAIWHRIMTDLMNGAPSGVETKVEFLGRLRAVATSLPRGYVKSVIGRMRGNVLALVDAKGFTPKND